MAITSDELQSIVSAVLSSIRTNSRTIDQLTPVTALADTDNLEVHGGKRVVFSILRNLILSKSGVDELKTELKPKLAELDDVVEIHSVRSDIGVILAQPSGPLTVYHGSTDEGYGVVYDSTRKRFYLVGTSTLPNPNTDVSVIQAYGDWSDEAVFGDSPESGSGRIPVRGKLYVCATDGGLYYWNGTDLVDLIKGILANTNALSILNRRGQVEPFAAVLTTDPDDDPIPEELVGKRVWSTQFNKFLEINIGGDPPYREPEDSAAVVDKFYVCDGRLYLGVKVSQTATTLKPLFDSEIEQLCRTHSITLTADDNGALSWSGAEHSKIRNGDIVEWENMGVLFRGTVISRTSSGSYDTLAVVYDFDGDEPLELHVLWINSNGTATDACFSSDQTLASAFNAKQTKLEDTADVVIESETNTTDGLYLTDSAKRAVFNDMFNLAAGSDGGYKPSEAPDPAKPYLLNTLWLSYEEAEREMLDYTSIITFWKRAIRRSGLNVFCIGSFDETTRTGTLNGISGLSLSEMTDILLAGNPTAAGAAYHFAFNPFIRTNLWQMWYMDGTVAGQKCFYKCANIEVACASYLRVGTDTFSHCPKLHTIIGPLYGDGNNPAPFRGCASLVNLPGFGWNGNLDISDSPLLSLASVSALIDKGKEGATITVHADVFAKLTGDCDGVTMVITAPTTRDKSAVPIVIANPGMFAVSDILTAPVITGDDGLPLRLTVTAVDAEGQPSVAPINAGALGGLSGCNIMLADSEPAQWAAVLNAAYAKNISFATD